MKWLWPFRTVTPVDRQANVQPEYVSSAGLTRAETALAQAIECVQKGNQDEALCLLNQISESERVHDIWMLLAKLYAQKHDWASFDFSAQQAVVLSDAPADTQFRLGEICFENKYIDAALDWLLVAVELDPDLSKAWLRLGEIHDKQENHEAALTAYQRAMESTDAECRVAALYHFGQIHHTKADWQIARQAYLDILQIDPSHGRAWMGLGHIHLLKDEAEHALHCYERAASLTDTRSGDLLIHHGMALRFLGRWEEAAPLFESVWKLNPQRQVNQWYLAQCLLALENWQGGWPLYKSRYTRRVMPFAEWKGQPIPGRTLLLLAEQGLGDEIMFASCIKDGLEAAQAKAVFVECEPRLVKLFQRSFPETTCIASNRATDGSWLPHDCHIDFQCHTGDLPAFFRTKECDYPRHTGYLRPDSLLQDEWAQTLNERARGRLKVGISWRGGTPATRQAVRTLGIGEIETILKVSGIYFISLQYGDVEADLTVLRQSPDIEVDHFPDLIPDYDATAAVVSQLDLVISVCTSLVHLAGALNTPTWVLTPFSPEWRYTAHQTRLLWYPSVTLLRQPSLNDWQSVVQKIERMLNERHYLSQ